MIKVHPKYMVGYINFRGRLDSRPNYNTEVDTFDTFDTFTGLKDKSALLADIGRRMYKKEDISMGMFDLDNFKSVNELLGYKIGDEFIKAVSEDISVVAEKHNVNAYRFGGDEFVVLLFSNTSKEEKEDILKEVSEKISENPKIQGRSDEYRGNAKALLTSYEKDNDKVNSIYKVNTKYDILSDIWNNATIAKEDPYIQQSLEDVVERRNLTYSTILKDCIESEKSPKMKNTLRKYQVDIEGNRESIDEYVLGKYDKNHEIYRLKKWIRDFEQNGFSLTGGIVTFKPSYYEERYPIDLINDVGEFLKQGKAMSKGEVYTAEIE